MPALLARAGWKLDVVSLSQIYKLSKHVHHLHLVEHVHELEDAALDIVEKHGQYDWVIPASDELLGELRKRASVDRRFLKLLPIAGPEGRFHLFSKLNLSRVLSRHGLPTPAWAEVSSIAMAIKQAQVLGFPCFAKRDRSYGGLGTFRCEHPASLEEIANQFAGEPFLLQQGLIGKLWAIEALYWQAQLQAFSASRCLSTTHPYGPSLKRCYGQSPPGLGPLLQRLGEALCAHGWANITIIQSDDHQLHCIEADLRPTIWLALDEHLGGDFAKVIKNLGNQNGTNHVQCYSGQSGDHRSIIHPQRLIQAGASDVEIRESLALLPEEEPLFMEELCREKFFALVPTSPTVPH
jgi:hypothetical protein